MSPRLLALLLAAVPLLPATGDRATAQACDVRVTGAATEVVLAIASEEAQEKKGKTRTAGKRLDLGSSKGDVVGGVRFEQLAIPAGAEIQAASLQLVSARRAAKPALLVIHGEASGDAAPFSPAPNDLSAREGTLAFASWDVPPWPEAGEAHVTPDLAAAVQEIVDDPGWASGNDMAFFITGSGKRSVVAFEGDTGLPLLRVDFVAPEPACAPASR